MQARTVATGGGAPPSPCPRSSRSRLRFAPVARRPLPPPRCAYAPRGRSPATLKSACACRPLRSLRGLAPVLRLLRPPGLCLRFGPVPRSLPLAAETRSCRATRIHARPPRSASPPSAGGPPPLDDPPAPRPPWLGLARRFAPRSAQPGFGRGGLVVVRSHPLASVLFLPAPPRPPPSARPNRPLPAGRFLRAAWRPAVLFLPACGWFSGLFPSRSPEIY